MKHYISWGLCLFFILGCSTTKIEKKGLGSFKTKEDALQEAFHQVVDKKGRVDFGRISENPDSLEIYLGLASEVTPRSSPDNFKNKNDVLAYYINTYNALAMYHAGTSGIKPKSLVKFFVLSKFQLGGEGISLRNLENEWIRPLGEPRIHFALNCMVKSCPRLPREIFKPLSLEQQLNRVTKEFINSEKHVKVSANQRKVELSQIFKWYEKDFLEKKMSLIDYINEYRVEKIPTNYDVTFLDYDWALNQKVKE